MTTFEVTIEGADEKPLRLLVAADNWVAAWQEGLRVLGIEEMPADSSCVVGHNGRVDIDIPTLKRAFTLKIVSKRDGPQPVAGHPLLLSESRAGDTIIQVHALTKNPKLFRRPPHLSASAASAIASAMRAARTTTPGVAEGPPAEPPRGTNGNHNGDHDAVTTPDPIARVLSELERQRLLSRPIRISSETGLPTTDVKRTTKLVRDDSTPTQVPRLLPTTDERKRPSHFTRQFDPVPSEQLPQLFRPVTAEGAPSSAREATLTWAVETAWQHVPCMLVVVLDCDGYDTCELIVGRGEREREARGCVVTQPAGSLPLGRTATLRRFAEPRPFRFARADDSYWELPVSSLLAAPIALRGDDGGGMWLLLVNATRGSGFTDGELRAVSYLARTVAGRL